MNRSSRKVNGWVLCSAGITRITACQPTSRRSTCSGPRLRTAGSSRFGDAASVGASTGREWIASQNGGFLGPALSTLGRNSALLSEPEIRAQCGSSARWDLCGGRLTRSRVQPPLPRPFPIRPFERWASQSRYAKRFDPECPGAPPNNTHATGPR